MKHINKTIFTLALAAIMLLLTVVAATSANADSTPYVVEKVEINDHALNADQSTKLDLERNQEIQIDVRLHATQAMHDVKIITEISGYEYEDTESVSAQTQVFDMKADTVYTKTLKLKLPNRMESTEYKLRLRIVDANTPGFEQDYNIFVDMPRHGLQIADAVFQPENSAKAGSTVLTAVRLENKGQKTEEDIKVTVSLPELGISTSSYIEEIASGDEVQTEEMAIKLPKCTPPGKYFVSISVVYNSGTQGVIELLAYLNVIENDACNASDTNTVSVVLPQQNSSNTDNAQTPAKDSTVTIRGVLEVILAILVGLLVIVGIIFGIAGLAKKQE